MGTITLNAGAAGTTTSFTIQSAKLSLNPMVDGNTLTFNNGNDLDVNNNGGAGPTYQGADSVINTFSVTVVAVPEPSGMVLTGLFASVTGVGAFIRWRRMAVFAA